MNTSNKNNENFVVETFSSETIGVLVQMAMELWPDTAEEEQLEHFNGLLTRENAAVFLLRQGDFYFGFIELSTRSDYVEGADYLPVGYVEGLFIREGYRQKGWGKYLMDTAAEWALQKGYSQLCSDCELHNEESIRFHLGSGFKEVSRNVCFARDISRK